MRSSETTSVGHLIPALLAIALAVVLAGCAGPTPAPQGAPDAEPASAASEKEAAPEGNGLEAESNAAAAAGAEEPAQPEPPERTGAIVCCFSWTQHTRGIADAIVEHTGADFYEILPAEPYGEENSDYYNESTRAYIEQHDDAARPALAADGVDLSGYATVYLGYPVWYGDSPRLVWTFVEAHAAELEGARVIPFCTSMSVSVGESARHMEALAPGADWEEGTRFEPGAPAADVAAWVDSRA